MRHLSRRKGNERPFIQAATHPVMSISISITTSTRQNAKKQTYQSTIGQSRIQSGMKGKHNKSVARCK